MTELEVPFFRTDICAQEIDEVVATLRSGWLTSGPKVRRFEREFAAATGASFAVAVNSCTAALHLAVEALGLREGQGVLVPTMTFAATAEIVRYQGAIPILVDCDPVNTHMDLDDAAQKTDSSVVGLIPVHVGGMMMDIGALQRFGSKRGLWIVEDAAHSFPAAWRSGADSPWQRCGDGTSAVACFSFYANKTITTGEGGIAVTNDMDLAERLRLMSLHGLSHDAWGRYSNNGNWDYQIIAPGYKYNLTDIAAAIGVHQLARAEEMRLQREEIAHRYISALSDLEEIELPPQDPNRIHSWHLFPIKLRLQHLSIERDAVIEELKRSGVGCSVHWRPLHLHPYYRETFGYKPEDFPVATAVWKRLISLPIFPAMGEEEIEHVIRVIRRLCARYGRQASLGRAAKSITSENQTEICVASAT
jgi:dTDP-4-amino-4,6-dideoxygalactose transaminase